MLGGDLRDADAAVPQLPHDFRKSWDIVDVLHALAHRLQDDGKGRVLAGNVQKLFGALALRTILAGTFVLAALRFGLTGYFAQNAWLMALVQILHAATFGAHHSASLKRLQRWFAGPLQGRGQALYTGISYGVGGTLGGLAMGWTWKTLAPMHTFGLAALAALIGAGCAAMSFRGEAERA